MAFTTSQLQHFKNLPNSYAEQVENAFLTEEDRIRQQINRFRKGGVIGTRAIDAQGQDMADIGARFIDNAVLAMEDPAFDCIQFQIDWEDPCGLFADESRVNSALRYLKDTNELTRYENLKSVIEQLRDLFDAKSRQSAKSYYLTGIDGLGGFNENYTKVGVPTELTLHCLDDIKWKTRAIMQMLNDIYYDSMRQIEILPRNLRRFSCYLTISDMRKLSEVYADEQTYESASDASADSENLADRNKYARKVSGQPIPTAPFKRPFYMSDAENSEAAIPELKQSVCITAYTCYLDGPSFPDGISNVEPNAASQDFKITLYHWTYYAMYPALNMFLTTLTPEVKKLETDPQKAGAMLWHAIKNYGAKLLSGYIDGAINVAKSFAMNSLSVVADKLGVRQVVNDVMQWTKPDVIMAKYGKQATDWLNDSLGLSVKEELKEAYFGDYRSAKGENEDAKNAKLARSQYFKEHKIAGEPEEPTKPTHGGQAYVEPKKVDER